MAWGSALCPPKDLRGSRSIWALQLLSTLYGRHDFELSTAPSNNADGELDNDDNNEGDTDQAGSRKARFTKQTGASGLQQKASPSQRRSGTSGALEPAPRNSNMPENQHFLQTQSTQQPSDIPNESYLMPSQTISRGSCEHLPDPKCIPSPPRSRLTNRKRRYSISVASSTDAKPTNPMTIPDQMELRKCLAKAREEKPHPRWVWGPNATSDSVAVFFNAAMSDTEGGS